MLIVVLISALVISSGLAVWFWLQLRGTIRLEPPWLETTPPADGSSSASCLCSHFLGQSVGDKQPSYCPRILLGMHTPTDSPYLFYALAGALDTGLVLISAEHRICFLNPQAEEILGVTHWVVQGRRLIQLVRDQQVEAMVQDVFSDGEAREITIYSDLNGRTLRLHCARLGSLCSVPNL